MMLGRGEDSTNLFRCKPIEKPLGRLQIPECDYSKKIFINIVNKVSFPWLASRISSAVQHNMLVRCSLRPSLATTFSPIQLLHPVSIQSIIYLLKQQ